MMTGSLSSATACAIKARGEAGVWLAHERLGYNYRMDEMSAALGVVQMQRIDEIIEKRAAVAEMYRERLGEIDGVQLPHIAQEVTRMSWFVYVIRVGWDEKTPEMQSKVRNHVMARLGEAQIGCRPYFTPNTPAAVLQGDVWVQGGRLPCH